MSVAFVREESAAAAAELPVRPRPISAHPNLVTAEGLEQLTTSLQAARATYQASLDIAEANDRRRAAEPALRDVAYFSERLASAKTVAAASEAGTVAFGDTVSFTKADGRRQTYRIVGEDEADPKTGSIAYVSPVARALLGKSVGDIVTVGSAELEIVEVFRSIP